MLHIHIRLHFLLHIVLMISLLGLWIIVVLYVVAKFTRNLYLRYFRICLTKTWYFRAHKCSVFLAQPIACGQSSLFICWRGAVSLLQIRFPVKWTVENVITFIYSKYSRSLLRCLHFRFWLIFLWKLSLLGLQKQISLYIVCLPYINLRDLK